MAPDEKASSCLVVGISIFTFAIALLPVVAYQIGKLEARLDLLQGKRKSRRCEDQTGPGREWDKTLAREFGVEIEAVPACLDNRARFERMRGYDTQQWEELERVYGKARIEEEGRRSYQRYFSKPKREGEYDLTH
jgi:hypothetical protein